MACSSDNSHTDEQYEEFQINVPYGKLAVKAYNAASGMPVLCLHGHFQNLAVFDGLAPLLPKSWYIVAFDCCSAGKSSFLPVGSTFDYLDLVYNIRSVVEGLKWNRVAIIAHSGGAAMSLAFSNMYPELVTSMIWIDLFTCYKTYDCNNTAKADWCTFLATALKEQLMWEKQNTIQYLMNLSKEEAVEFFSNAYGLEKLPKAQSGWLARRYVKENEDLSFGYAVDRRYMKYGCILSQSDTVFNMMINSISCHLMMIKYKSGMFVDAETIASKIAHYERVCKSFEYVELPGTHCSFMTEPEAIAPIITEFINKHAV